MAGIFDLKTLGFERLFRRPTAGRRLRRRACPQASAIMVTEPLTTFERYDSAEVSISIRDL